MNQFFVLAQSLNHFLWLLWRKSFLAAHGTSTMRKHTQPLDLLRLFITIYKYYAGFMCIENHRKHTNNEVPQTMARLTICFATKWNEKIYVDVRALVVCLLMIPFVRSNVVLSFSLIFQSTLIKWNNLCSGTCHVSGLIEMKSGIDISLPKKIELKKQLWNKGNWMNNCLYAYFTNVI